MQKFDVHQAITDRIIAQIEQGAGQFKMPWHTGSTAPLHMPENAATRKRYRGVNVVSLWIAAQANGYSSNKWATFKQWQERKASVRKGEKGTIVIFFKEYDVAPDPTQEDDDGRRIVARASWVFNAAQVDGTQQLPLDPEQPSLGPVDPIKAADAFAAGTRATIRHGGSRAFYRPADDFVQMPDEALFTGTSTSSRSEAYYSTLLHELTHWSGAEKRCNRDFGKRFGDKAYAFEELVAELGAAFLCAGLGITNEPRQDHAQYLAHWLDILKGDRKAITHAAAKASAAVDYLTALNGAPEDMAIAA